MYIFVINNIVTNHTFNFFLTFRTLHKWPRGIWTSQCWWWWCDEGAYPTNWTSFEIRCEIEGISTGNVTALHIHVTLLTPMVQYLWNATTMRLTSFNCEQHFHVNSSNLFVLCLVSTATRITFFSLKSLNYCTTLCLVLG